MMKSRYILEGNRYIVTGDTHKMHHGFDPGTLVECCTVDGTDAPGFRAVWPLHEVAYVHCDDIAMPENAPVAKHPAVGKRYTFRPDLPPYDPATDTEPGTLLVGPGMGVEVLAVFHWWNGYKGNTILWCECAYTGKRVHCQPSDFGLTAADFGG